VMVELMRVHLLLVVIGRQQDSRPAG